MQKMALSFFYIKEIRLFWYCSALCGRIYVQCRPRDDTFYDDFWPMIYSRKSNFISVHALQCMHFSNSDVDVAANLNLS